VAAHRAPLGAQRAAREVVTALPRQRGAQPDRPGAQHLRGRVLLIRRQRGLLAGTWTMPAIARAGRGQVDGAAQERDAAAEVLGAQAVSLRATLAGQIRHVFTHRDLVAEVYDVDGLPATGRGADESPDADADVRWASPAELDEMAVSSLLRKLLAVGSSTAAVSALRRSGKATRAVNGRRNA